MEIDPIVLLAYISVAVNVITMIAACIAYAIFHVRKRRRRSGSAAPRLPEGPVVPVFLQRCSVSGATDAIESIDSAVEAPANRLAEV